MTKNSMNIVLQPFLDSITTSIVIHNDEEVGLFKSGSHRVPWTHFVIESKMMRDSTKMKRLILGQQKWHNVEEMWIRAKK